MTGALRRLAGAVEWLHADAGVRLFTAGDEPDGMYGIVSGRVRFFTESDGHVVMTADAGPGVTFGEGALLVGGGRSRRPSSLATPCSCASRPITSTC